MTEFLRKISAPILNRIAKILISLRISANFITIMGVAGHLITAIIIARGIFLLGGLLVLFFGLFDAVDGAMARLREDENPFGAFLDSVSDRISEILLYLGILIFYTGKSSLTGVFLVFCAAVSSLMVSYCRSRAESIGEIVKIGILTRVERYIILVFFLMLRKVEIGLILITLLSCITLFQRIWFVFRKKNISDHDWKV